MLYGNSRICNNFLGNALEWRSIDSLRREIISCLCFLFRRKVKRKSTRSLLKTQTVFLVKYLANAIFFIGRFFFITFFYLTRPYYRAALLYTPFTRLCFNKKKTFLHEKSRKVSLYSHVDTSSFLCERKYWNNRFFLNKVYKYMHNSTHNS